MWMIVMWAIIVDNLERKEKKKLCWSCQAWGLIQWQTLLNDVKIIGIQKAHMK